MPIEKTLTAYRVERMNCAQSIYAGFREALNVSQSVIDAACMLGGGKAENGRCGALHAALDLSQRTETKNELEAGFEKMAGSINCREIRAKKLLTCDQCVELAATILNREISGLT